MALPSQLCYYLVELVLNVCLIINKAVLTKIDIAISFLT